MNVKDNADSHVFALYYSGTTETLSRLSVGNLCTITDRVLCHRILHVIRLKKGEVFTLFDRRKHMVCTLEAISERSLQGMITSCACNVMCMPCLSFLLPLLKKEAFEDALYTLTELGVSHIHLVTTKKTHRAWAGAKEFERIERILQAAGEQSKNFALPAISEPEPLEKIVQSFGERMVKVFFDPEGRRFDELVGEIKKSPADGVVMLIGPEGDLTSDEKVFIGEHGFVVYQLTPTILRAQQAVAVSVGALRSLIHP